MILIAGVDEAGRGPLAGPVVAAAVVLPHNHGIAGLADSKKLTEKQRNYFFSIIREKALYYAIAQASVQEIDHLNILQASLLAMQRAIDALGVVPQEALIDGNQLPRTSCPARAIVRGDETIPVISAASILAKVSRDEEMVALHGHYPAYGLDRHKGYPTKAHLQALRQFGASDIHRRSFAPVAAVAGINVNKQKQRLLTEVK